MTQKMRYINIFIGITLVIVGFTFLIMQVQDKNYKWSIGSQKLLSACVFTILLGLFLIIEEL